MNELMNCGTVFENNLIYGLKAQQAKTLDDSAKAAKAGCVGLGLLCVVGLAFFGFYFGRSVVDDMIYNDTKYDYAKLLFNKEMTLPNLWQISHRMPSFYREHSFIAKM